MKYLLLIGLLSSTAFAASDFTCVEFTPDTPQEEETSLDEAISQMNSGEGERKVFSISDRALYRGCPSVISYIELDEIMEVDKIHTREFCVYDNKHTAEYVFGYVCKKP